MTVTEEPKIEKYEVSHLLALNFIQITNDCMTGMTDRLFYLKRLGILLHGLVQV